MIIFLNKKRILAVAVCLVLSLCFAGILNKGDETIETVALPVEDKVIIIDAGHGYPDERGFK